MKNSICFFNTIQEWGGGEKWHFEMASFLLSKNYDVHFITSKKGDLAKKLENTGIKTFFVDVKNFSFLNTNKVNSVANYLKENKLEIVIVNSSQDMKFGGLAAKKAKIKHIIYRRGSAIPIKNSLTNRYFFSNVITNVIANSLETKKTINTKGKLFNEDKIFVLRNGIDTKSYIDSANLNQNKKSNNKIVLGNIGRLVKQKNQLFLLEVAKKLKEKEINFELKIGGEGKLRNLLESKITAYQLENQVFLEGFIDSPAFFLNDIDVFLLSSLWEGFGYVLAEAMLLKKPVIAFNNSSNPELITNNKNGFLTKKNNVSDFTEKIIDLINDPDKRNKMGEFGYNKIINEYDFNVIQKQFETFLNSLE
jgi:glycosyltransferase involved in cell wall biosynthesis